MTKLAVTIHHIVNMKNPEENKAPGTIHAFDDETYADLLLRGAIREPSADELVIWESLNPPAIKEAPPAKPTKPAPAKKAAVTPAPVDPDVTNQPDLPLV